MFYIIDFDTLRAECKHEDKTPLTRYIDSNGLADAVTLVGDMDELEFAFTDDEIAELIINLEGKESDDLWGLLNSSETIPTYTSALGKKLLKSSPKQDSNESPVPKPGNPKQDSNESPVPKPGNPKQDSNESPVPKASNSKVKLDMGSTVVIIHNKGRPGSIINTVVDAVESEFCSSVSEVVEYIVENHITGLGTLADKKYAISRIKGLIKLGKIKTEIEGL